MATNNATNTGNPITVPQGGTGRATSTTAYGTICAGTTATGALQTVAPGTAGQTLISAGNAALPAYGTLGVIGGGTGRVTSTTPYGTICAGTTAAGALQTVSPGTSGQALVSAGASALPAYGTLGVSGGGTGRATSTTAYGTICAGTTAAGALQTVAPGTAGQTLISAGTSALPAYGTLGVNGGGTGVTSTTAYAVLCGGTSTTNPLQSIASVGTTGQVLTSNGAAALPTFQANPYMGTLLATATASNSATIDFANNLSATYDNYLVMIDNVVPVSNNVTFQLRIGTGSPPTYSTLSYSGGGNSVVGGSNTAYGTVSGGISLTRANALQNATGGRSFNAFMSVLNVNSGGGTTVNYQAQMTDNTFSIAALMGGGTWAAATVVTSLRFFMSSGDISTGTFRLYGIRNS